MDNDDVAIPDSVGTSAGALDEQATGRTGFSKSRGQKSKHLACFENYYI